MADCANEAKRRRAPVDAQDRAARAAREPGGGSTRRWKAPWFDQAVAFDEAVVEAGLAARGSGVGREAVAVRGGSRQRVSEATSHARFAVENTVTGSVCRRGCRSQLRQDREAPCSGGIWGQNPHAHRREGCDKAEAGGSPSSEAPPGWSAGGLGRWRACAVPESRKAPREARPGIDGSAGCSCRRSVAEVGRRIFFEPGSVRREASRISAG